MDVTTAIVLIAALAISASVLYLLNQKYQIVVDLRTLARLIPIATELRRNADKQGWNMVACWYQTLSLHASRTAFIFEDRKLTFQEVESLSNQMAHVLHQHFCSGATIALMMSNSPEFVCWILAAMKLDIKVAFINTNVKLSTLAHCLRSVDCAGIFFDEDTEWQVLEMWETYPDMHSLRLYIAGRSDDKRVTSISDDEIRNLPTTSFHVWKQTYVGSTVGYIFTSGTTGLPKAALVSHFRLIGSGRYFSTIGGMSLEDIYYDCLPMFHSAGLVPVSTSIIVGLTTCIAKKFSLTRFWIDVVEHECTVFQYVGELGRYLVNHAQSHPEVFQIKHKLRLAVGNGLLRDVWDQFQDGFQIPVVLEFYGSTEGNGSLSNKCDRKEYRGAVGRCGLICRSLLGHRICKYDVDTETLVRVNGRCVQCAANEVGVLLCKITSRRETAFLGYTDQEATTSKVARDVVAKGDIYFITGDLLSRDARGFYFFHDRIGDTFRWCGENVSTMEVSLAVSSFSGIIRANVYGVKVPHAPDGRACMLACIVSDEATFIQRLPTFYSHCITQLPKYAVPRFLRFLSSSSEQHTSTYKQVKTGLREEGCNPVRTSDDKLYYLTSENLYAELTVAIYASWVHLQAAGEKW